MLIRFSVVVCIFETQYFVNIAASGSLTELTYGVPSEVKSALGYAAYLIKGAEMLPRLTENKMILIAYHMLKNRAGAYLVG